MKKVFVRSAQLDENFYAITDGVKLYDESGFELHESFSIVEPLNYKHFIVAVVGMAVVSLLYWVCFSTDFYTLVVSFSEV